MSLFDGKMNTLKVELEGKMEQGRIQLEGKFEKLDQKFNFMIFALFLP